MDMMEVSSIFSTRNLDSSIELSSLIKMINLGSSLTNDEREMLIALLQKYIRVYFNDYLNLILNSVNLINPNKYKSINDFYILPIKSQEDFNKPISCDCVYYLFCNIQDIKSSLIFKNKKLHSATENSIPKNIRTSSAKHLILIDDFSGTGKTIQSYLHHLEQDLNIPKNKFSIVLIASMKESYDYLTSNGYDVYCNIIQEKGISGINNIAIQKKYRIIMQNLENKFGFRECDKFGYGKAESLISLIRTPNNTFPIFWDGKRNKNAPFERN